jgi:hypothetical protein
MNKYAVKSFSKGKAAAFKKGTSELFPIPQAEIDRSGALQRKIQDINFCKGRRDM